MLTGTALTEWRPAWKLEKTSRRMTPALNLKWKASLFSHGRGCEGINIKNPRSLLPPCRRRAGNRASVRKKKIKIYGRMDGRMDGWIWGVKMGRREARFLPHLHFPAERQKCEGSGTFLPSPAPSALTPTPDKKANAWINEHTLSTLFSLFFYSKFIHLWIMETSWKTELSANPGGK